MFIERPPQSESCIHESMLQHSADLVCHPEHNAVKRNNNLDRVLDLFVDSELSYALIDRKSAAEIAKYLIKMSLYLSEMVFWFFAMASITF